ncbi:MAG: pyridoxal phosphate-dependent decarboxylase family protein [Vulcanimicrobiaceae bacterium]
MPDDFRSQLERVADWVDCYYKDARRYPVLSRYKPGELIGQLPAQAPEQAEPFAAIFADFERLIVPGITHWNHPRFFAYFSISAAPVAILAEMLASTLDVNAMLWRTSPAATELEDVVTRWLARLMQLPDDFHGIIYDTASISGFTALAAARERAEPSIRAQGMAGRSDLSPLRVYITEQTHSHIEKGAIALGIGRQHVVKIACDDRFAMRPDALEAQIRDDLAKGLKPVCVCATVGTTSTTSSDPVAAIAAITRKHNVWLHVDAAYAGPATILPEVRPLLDGIEHADSLVMNPHKWLFVPIDLSVLYVREPEVLRRAFSLVADYLQTPETDVHNYMDYGLQLGRRFRALKMWFVLRYYGAEAIRKKLRSHIALAQELASWIDGEPGWEVVAPHPLSVVCFRYRGDDGTPEEIDARNQRLADDVNATGDVFISTTRLHGRVVLRVAIGNERTTSDDVELAWQLLREHAKAKVGAR